MFILLPLPAPTAMLYPSLVQRLFTSLTTTRSYEQARAAIAHTRTLSSCTLHAFRAALAELNRPAYGHRELVWPAIAALREAFEAADTTLDTALLAAIVHDPLHGLAQELSACGEDQTRALHAIETVWKHLSPPGTRAAATLVDMLRARPLNGLARCAVYSQLVARGIDVRSSLADDALLSASDRLQILGALAAHRADKGQQRRIDWKDGWTTLARTLADWTLYATHPRQVFYGFRKLTWLAPEDPAYIAALDRLARQPLTPEVRIQLEQERTGTPVELTARALGSGRYECARCGDRRVAACARRAMDPDDPALGAETEFACASCDQRYFSAWELATLDGTQIPIPVGWSAV